MILKHSCKKCINDSYNKVYDFDLKCDVWHCANCNTKYKKVRVAKKRQTYMEKMSAMFELSRLENWSKEKISIELNNISIEL